jgi:hypothetical protein
MNIKHILAGISALLYLVHGTWIYEKQILDNGTNFYKRLELDQEIYRLAAPDLRDLRVVTRNGQEVPYQLLRREGVNLHYLSYCNSNGSSCFLRFGSKTARAARYGVTVQETTAADGVQTGPLRRLSGEVDNRLGFVLRYGGVALACLVGIFAAAVLVSRVTARNKS